MTAGHGYAENKRSEKLKLYQIWSGIKQRCFNKKCSGYKKYGAKGITMNNEWKNSFTNFLNDMGDRPFSNASIDRIDNTKGYSKENCRWATKEEQANNTKKNIYITFGSATKTLANWCKIFEMPHATALGRIRKEGMTPQQALTTPTKHKIVKVGDVYGALTVIKLGDYKPYKSKQKTREIFCICTCGKNHKTVDARLKFKNVVRCSSCAAKIGRKKQLEKQRTNPIL